MLKSIIDDLEKGNPDHYTSNGLPRVDVVSEKAGRDVTRKEINEAMLSEPVTVEAEPVMEPIVVEEQKPLIQVEPEVKAEPATKEEQLKAVQDALDEKRKQIEVLNSEIEKLKLHEYALIRNVKPVERTSQEDTDERMKYIRKQNELRMARYNEANEIRKKLGLPDNAKSPIDAAMARKVGRGRPQY